MNDALNGRCEYRPRGRDPDENLGLLAEAIAKSAHLFNQGGRLVWIHARELRSVDTGILRELIRACVVTKHPVRGDEGWGVEYRPYVPDDKIVIALLTKTTSARSLRLIDLAAKA